MRLRRPITLAAPTPPPHHQIEVPAKFNQQAVELVIGANGDVGIEDLGGYASTDKQATLQERVTALSCVVEAQFAAIR